MNKSSSTTATIFSGVGFAVLIGGSLVVIGVGWQATLLVAAWLLGAAVFIAAEVRWIMRRSGFWMTVLISVVVLVIFHPLIFGLPGRIGEALFLTQINTSMKEEQVLALMMRTGGDESWLGTSGPTVRFTTIGTICVASGDEVRVTLDDQGHPRSWSVDHWGEFC